MAWALPSGAPSVVWGAGGSGETPVGTEGGRLAQAGGVGVGNGAEAVSEVVARMTNTEASPAAPAFPAQRRYLTPLPQRLWL